ncbi:MAG: bile acid:sodium symporter, partial [Planctomycetota bacterium]
MRRRRRPFVPPMARIAGFLRRHLIWLLLAAYAVACVAPGPGAAIAQSNLSEGLGGGGRVTAPLLMVAVLLFLASMAVELGELRVLLRRPGVWLASLVCVWVGPALAVALAAWLLPGLAGGPVGGPAGGPVAGLLLGMALVAAMPVANSSVAWTQQAGGSLPWSLGLVVVSILLTPLVTPPLLRLAGMSLAGGQGEFVEQIVSSFSGAPFVVWVLLPTLAGLAARRVLGADAVAELAPTRQVASAVILLVLNYANGAVALPQFFQHPTASVLLA